jgi:septal ring factor EnvC (AmiA/AmiB activator)
MKTLKTEVNALKTDMANVADEINAMKTDMVTMKAEIVAAQKAEAAARKADMLALSLQISTLIAALSVRAC